VGATGWATGPHLHFEFRVGGKHQDPMLVAKAGQPVALDPTDRARFQHDAQAASGRLEVAASLHGARARFE
jgi:murein DD-endopeptidase MepM/ murein hydrolase activator NlpD